MSNPIRILIPAYVSVAMLVAACGVVPATLRQDTLKLHPSFADNAETIHLTHKWSAANPGRTIFTGSYNYADPALAGASDYEVKMSWERAENFKIHPQFTIFGIKLNQTPEEKMLGLRLSATAESAAFELIGVVRQIRAEEWPDDEEPPGVFNAFPCRFELFDDGESIGSVTINGSRRSLTASDRNFDFVIAGDSLTVHVQTYDRKAYATVTGKDGLRALFDTNPRNLAVNTRDAEVLVKPGQDAAEKSHVYRAFLVADAFTQFVFDDRRRD